MSLRTGWWLPDANQTEKRLLENEYLKREFKLLIYSGPQERDLQLINAQERQSALVLTDTSVKNFKALRKFPRNSIVLFILSDETYNLKLSFFALFNSRIKVIVRNYPLGRIRKIRKKVCLFLAKSKRVCSARNLAYLFPKAFASGVYLTLCQLLITILSSILRKPIHVIPQGYNSGFAQIYAKTFHLQSDESLFDFALRVKEGEFKKKLDLVFLGQIGSLDRRIMLEEAQEGDFEKALETKILINEKYNEGQNSLKQQEFFELVLKSRYALCPPGNYSGSTFRFFESLIAHTYPICDSFILSDPLYDSNLSLKWTNFKSNRIADHLENIHQQNEEIRAEISRVLELIESLKAQISLSLIGKGAI